MRRLLEFRSAAFPSQPSEEEEINPGRHGKVLAQYLAAALRERGNSVIGITAEDWGWRVDIENRDFPLWIGCGNVDREASEFLCFVEPSKPSVGWFNRRDTTPATGQLSTELFEILSANPDVEGLTWTD